MRFSSSRTGSSSRASSSRQFAGILEQRNLQNEIVTSKRVYTDHELVIGRDKSRCQYVIDEPVVSNRHVRIYTIVFEKDMPSEVSPLVYAEDLSRNGTFWNASLIGKGNGGFLLSPGDVLRISHETHFTFSIGPTDPDPPVFDLTQETEMAHFNPEYNVTDRLLGSGAYGKVFMAIEQTTRTQLACKVVDLRKLKPQSRAKIGRLERPAAAEDVDSQAELQKLRSWVGNQKRDNRLEEILKTYYREAEILASINHPNIIRLEKVYVTDNTMYMFQDLVTAGDLFSYLEHKNGKLLEVEAAVIIRQILIALQFLHDKNVVHRDLKPENVLMTSLAAGCRVILTDFGAARSVTNVKERMSSLVGTLGYTAPEICNPSKLQTGKTGYTRAVDMWSVGCLTVLLLTGGLAFVDPRTGEYSEKLANECNLVSLETSPEWSMVRQRPKEFVSNLLVVDERKRLSASEALEHAWFSNDLHKTNFVELYQRCIKNWRSRILKQPVVEFVNAPSIWRLPCSQGIMDDPTRKSRRRSHTPVDPPYIPFARNMHQPLFPQRVTGPRMMSEEVRNAIKEKWTFKADSSSESSQEFLLPVTPFRSGKGSIPPLRTKTVVKPLLSKTPRSRTFGPLRPKAPLPREEKLLQEDNLADDVVQSIEELEEDPVADLRSNRAFSPSAWDKVRISQKEDEVSDRERDKSATLNPAAASSSTRAIPLRPFMGISSEQIRPARGGSVMASPDLGHRRIVVPSSPSTQNVVKGDNRGNSTLLQHALLAKANTKLKLKSQNLRRKSVSVTPPTKKRRRGDMFDIADEEEEEETSTSKKSKTGWEAASRVDFTGEERRSSSAEGDGEELTAAAVVRGSKSPSSGETRSALYLPRL